MSNNKNAEIRRDVYKTFRISPREKESLTFLTETLNTTPSDVVRRAIKYFAYNVALGAVAEPVETAELAISNLS